MSAGEEPLQGAMAMRIHDVKVKRVIPSCVASVRV